ncbi:hypothetical protein Ddc_13187 [Ditylenchus destructor]|nr:hypothetical protein Ddc_13187 [Ditylenchus destructor]
MRIWIEGTENWIDFDKVSPASRMMGGRFVPRQWEVSRQCDQTDKDPQKSEESPSQDPEISCLDSALRLVEVFTQSWSGLPALCYLHVSLIMGAGGWIYSSLRTSLYQSVHLETRKALFCPSGLKGQAVSESLFV